MSEAQAPDGEFEQLLEYLRQNRGFDFSGYKRPSLVRRVLKRMQSINVESFSRYLDYLEVHPEEFSALFNTILINVTSFFRDEESWKFLETAILPQIVSGRKGDAPIRIWSAGCASGEEAYSLAMVMADALGKEALHTKVKIYATDVDEEALIMARQAAYSEKDVQPVPPELREKSFDRVNGRYLFNSDLRRAVIFGRHDLVQDAPISHLDLLVCRNTLMYFNAETQARIVSRFNYAINPGGFLMLGKAEMLLLYSSLYTPVELKHRIFSKTAPNGLRDRSVILDQNSGSDPDLLNRQTQLRAAIFESGQLAQVVVATDGNLIMANEQARQLYGLERDDVGRPFRDLALSYQPAELRSLIDQVYAERRIVTLANVERRLKDGGTRSLDIQVMPLSEDGALVGVCITFQDVTRYRKVQEDFERARVESEAANEELETTNEELQSTNEELETTNEELQSTNEELETTNEELQSSNEELETMNEEMQSTNEELQTINDELRVRTDELNRSNAFLQSVLASLRGGVVVVDTKLDIIVWNPGAEELWGLRSGEVKGRSLLGLDIGLPVRRLRNPVQTCIAEGTEAQELILDAVNRRGRNIKCRVAINPLTNPQGQREGAIIVTQEMGM
jgi:two-component system, chemotaxis family, CheB/CheR fusion protein